MTLLSTGIICSAVRNGIWRKNLKRVLVGSAGIEHVGGDMFESVPKGDAIMIKVRRDFFPINLENMERKRVPHKKRVFVF